MAFTSPFSVLSVFSVVILHLALFGTEINWQTEQDSIAIVLEITSNKISLNDTLKVFLQVESPKNFKLNKDKIIWRLLNNFSWDLLKENSTEKVKGDRKTFQMTLEMIPMKTGELSLDFKKLELFNAKKIEFKMPAFPISVFLPPEEPVPKLTLLNLEPQFPLDLNIVNRNQFEMEENQAAEGHQAYFEARTFPWLFILIVSLITLSWLIWKFVIPQQRVIIPYGLLSPKKKALMTLEKMYQNYLLDGHISSEFYVVLPQIIRNYIEEQFLLFGSALTTSEFIEDLKQSSQFSDDFLNKVKDILERTDAVKFANYTPSQADGERLYTESKNLIELTS